MRSRSSSTSPRRSGRRPSDASQDGAGRARDGASGLPRPLSCTCLGAPVIAVGLIHAGTRRGPIRVRPRSHSRSSSRSRPSAASPRQRRPAKKHPAQKGVTAPAGSVHVVETDKSARGRRQHRVPWASSSGSELREALALSLNTQREAAQRRIARPAQTAAGMRLRLRCASRVPSSDVPDGSPHRTRGRGS
jgi:hypothetical protein